MVGGSAEDTIRTVYTDLGLEPDPAAMAESDRWLHEYTAELFDGGLPWCPGARELLEALAAERTPMALVTNTQRALTERALNSIGEHYFSASVCGDEVPQGKPAPDAYLRAAALLGPGAVGSAWRSRIRSPAPRRPRARDARCWWCPMTSRCPQAARRAHLSSLAGVGVADLRRVYDDLSRGTGERSA